MRFKEELLKNYEKDGYICLHNYFSRDEVTLIKAQLPELFAEESPGRVLEKTNGAVRSVYGSHTTNRVFNHLIRHPRLVELARQILGIDIDKMADLIGRYGIVAPKGEAGLTLFFHGNIVHGSANNISPYNRAVAIITYNNVENVPLPIAENTRPEFLAANDYTALLPLSDQVLFE
jgi:ectoine hydroxylase-related dioxygenase (phytanoyl-CoA dioxygenase family)